MIIAVLADTHGKIEPVIQVLKPLKADAIIFAGDFYHDGFHIARALKTKFYGVKGNCDAGSTAAGEQVLEFMGRKIFLVHGHQYGVKQSLNRLYYRARELEVDAVIYGHTHIPHLEKTDGLWMINPGSPTRPRLNTPGTYVLLEMNPDTFEPRLINL